MKFNGKTGILAALLVLPVLVFLLLDKFGSNHYNVQVYYPLDSVYQDGKYQITGYHTIPEFNLIDQDGKPLKGSDLRGSIYVTDFFFTTCPGICPKLTNQLKRVQEEFASNDQIKILSITVDPAHDSAEVLKNYAELNRAIPNKWFFATGQKDSIYNLAHNGYFISAGEEKNGPEAFLHSSKLILVDKEGRIRGYYDGTSQTEVDRLVTEIKVILHEYANSK
jgi:protein SCO1/2